MSTFYELWKANAAIGEITALYMAMFGLLLATGWLLIALILPAHRRVAARYAYFLAMVLIVWVIVWWFI